ncbi:MAG: hypothetical protein K1Y36_25665, partial [Blastocatellia bacterium]|nr:hypothetical protein [Blastocatellia bacterium]
PKPDTPYEKMWLGLLRPHYPELDHFSDRQLLAGWNAYSIDIFLQNPQSPSGFDEGFLAYLYVESNQSKAWSGWSPKLDRTIRLLWPGAEKFQGIAHF